MADYENWKANIDLPNGSAPARKGGRPGPSFVELECGFNGGCIHPPTCRAFGNGRGCAVPQTGAELLHCERVTPQTIFDAAMARANEDKVAGFGDVAGTVGASGQ